MSELQPYILAIDSSTSILRVGLSLNNGVVASLEQPGRFSHAEYIFKLIENILIQNGIAGSSIKAIVVSTGPGSFTGLRIGMAAAKGLAVALKIPIVGISTFSAMAGRIYNQFGPVGVVIRSRRDEFYLGLIDSPVFEENRISVVNGEELKKWSHATKIYPIDFKMEDLDISSDGLITALEFVLTIADLLNCSQAKLEMSGGDDISRLEPLYIQKFPLRKAR
jgi:tRNA threonylcarbamoyladenosine biosynthesis protein TsaB